MRIFHLACQGKRSKSEGNQLEPNLRFQSGQLSFYLNSQTDWNKDGNENGDTDDDRNSHEDSDCDQDRYLFRIEDTDFITDEDQNLDWQWSSNTNPNKDQARHSYHPSDSHLPSYPDPNLHPPTNLNQNTYPNPKADLNSFEVRAMRETNPTQLSAQTARRISFQT